MPNLEFQGFAAAFSKKDRNSFFRDLILFKAEDISSFGLS